MREFDVIRADVVDHDLHPDRETWSRTSEMNRRADLRVVFDMLSGVATHERWTARAIAVPEPVPDRRHRARYAPIGVPDKSECSEILDVRSVCSTSCRVSLTPTFGAVSAYRLLVAQFLLQMAGWMGSGKSTIASAVGNATRAVVLDHDTSKTAVMAAGVPHPPAGAASYEVLFAVAADLLRQGHSVVIDSPAAYASIPERGLALAEQSGIQYFFAECECPDDLAHLRVASRDARPSQVSDQSEATAVRADPRRVPHRPAHGALLLDTTADLGSCTQQLLHYLRGSGASGPVVSSPV